MKRRDLLILAVIALTFVGAGAAKMMDPAAFAADLRAYHLVPDRAAPALALWLPWMEAVAGLALFWRPLRAPGLSILLGLSVLFLFALSSAWIRGLDLSCGCFGHGARESGIGYLPALLRDVLLVLGVFHLLLRAGSRGRAAGSRQPP